MLLIGAQAMCIACNDTSVIVINFRKSKTHAITDTYCTTNDWESNVLMAVVGKNRDLPFLCLPHVHIHECFWVNTVLSGPEERAGCTFYLKIRTTPAWKINHTQNVVAVKATNSAALLTSKRLYFDQSKHFSRFPCLACVCNIDIKYRLIVTSMATWLEDRSKNKNKTGWRGE